jgi:hypothetical protein
VYKKEGGEERSHQDNYKTLFQEALDYTRWRVRVDNRNRFMVGIG